MIMDNNIRYRRCLRCNRILKTEKAQKRGYGSCCWKKYLEQNTTISKPLLNIQKGNDR